jgi:phage terminase large subunit
MWALGFYSPLTTRHSLTVIPSVAKDLLLSFSALLVPTCHGDRIKENRTPCHDTRPKPTLAPAAETPYTPYPRQKQFHDSKATYRLFGGAAGPGKTKALLWEAIQIARKNSGCDTLLLRRTFPELEGSLLLQFRRDVPRHWYYSYNEAKHIVTWNNGSTTRFGYCRNENDVYQYQGAEFLFIGVDELTHFTLKQWQFLTSRNRCPIPGTKPRMAGATNPGNIGHAWVKALWVDRVAPSGYDRPEQYDPNDYDFISARITDNPIYANDQNYLKTLNALPERLRQAFLEGDWNVLAGQFFDIFEIGRHTARAEELQIQWWWPRWISIDWGFHHPTAVYWHTAVPALATNNPQQPFTPRIVTYREFVKNEMSLQSLAQQIIDRNQREKIAGIYLSPDAFSHRTSDASVAEQLSTMLELHGLPRPVEATDDRIGGWQLMYQLLENDQWLIADNCRELIECLPRLIRDERRVEDVKKIEGDDPADAARYGLVSGVRHAGFGAHYRAPGAGQAPPENFASAHRFVPGMPLGVQIEQQISALDPTSRAIQAERLRHEAQHQLGAHKFRSKRKWHW